MALSTRGSGILESHVEWSEVEKEMQKSLETSAYFGPKKSAKNIGEGNGFCSRMALVDPDWQGVKPDEKLPLKFIAKICCTLTMVEFSQQVEAFEGLAQQMVEMEDTVRECHNAEVTVYEIIKRYDPTERIPLTKIFATRKFDEKNKEKGYILMEYHFNMVPMHLADNLTPEELHPILKSIAILQAMTFKLSESDRKSLPKNHFENMAQAFNDDTNRKMMDGLKEFFEPKYHELVDKVDAIHPDIIGKGGMSSIDKLSDVMKMKRVISHGDLWSSNMIFSKHHNKLKLSAIIDFQTAHLGCGTTDVAILLFTSLSGKDRRENWKLLIKKFYHYLKHEIEGEMPYTFEQLEESYKKLVPFAGFYIVPMMGPIVQYIESKDPEGAVKVKEQVKEKMVCMMEDIIQYYQPQK